MRVVFDSVPNAEMNQRNSLFTGVSSNMIIQIGRTNRISCYQKPQNKD